MEQVKKLSFEFLTIVVGVLTALAVNDWHDRSVERRLGEEYLQRIEGELHDARQALGRLDRATARATEAGAAASAFFEGAAVPQDRDQIIQSVYNMGRDPYGKFEVTTYEDLIATGGLRLIADADLREAIQQAYKAVLEVEAGRSPNRDEYLTGVRGWIPQRVVNQLRANCADMSAEGWTCPPVDLDDRDVDAIMRHLSTDSALLAFRVREQGLSSVRPLIDRAIAAVEDALVRLQARKPATAP